MMPRTATPAASRLWDRVDKRGPDECWQWLGSINPVDGYGIITERGRSLKVHRVAYEDAVGPIPDGLYLDHLCRNRWCCNPAHLEPVTNAENILRGVGAPAQNARKSVCPEGHPYDYVHPRLGWRRCTKCDNDRRRPRRRKQSAPNERTR